jgi:ribosomal protein S18 acetylase RimI-like enzyme
MNDITFTTGEVDEALSIMREAAQWLIDSGKPLWRIEDLRREQIKNPAEEFVVLRQDGKAIAAMILNFYDPFVWPDIEKGSSGFIHKLAVRREFAGKGCAEKLIEYAKKVCLEKGIAYLRLDSDPSREGLRRLYEKTGFKLVEVRKFHTKKYGDINCAKYEMKI